ncbi:hypothetical protein ACFX1X_023029 [Malus domestica]
MKIIANFEFVLSNKKLKNKKGIGSYGVEAGLVELLVTRLSKEVGLTRLRGTFERSSDDRSDSSLEGSVWGSTVSLVTYFKGSGRHLVGRRFINHANLLLLLWVETLIVIPDV